MKVRRGFETLMLWVLGVVIATGVWQMYGRWLLAGDANGA
jgi:hypothetical protein